MRVLDSHLHLWDPSVLDYSWLDGALAARFGADELEAARGGRGEQAAIFVQADCAPEQFLDEVRWVATLAERTGVRGIVAGVLLDRGAATERDLDAVAGHPLVVGVRHLLQSEPDGFAGTPAFREGAAALAARDLTFDACVNSASQVRDVAALAADIPQLKIVLDHLGKPSVGTAGAPATPAEEWADALDTLAPHEQVHAKLSGLAAEAHGDWSPAQVAPFFDAALSTFGPQRLMAGSDWPVSAVDADGYRADARQRWFGAVTAWASSRGLDVDAILWGNAARFYGIR